MNTEYRRDYACPDCGSPCVKVGAKHCSSCCTRRDIFAGRKRICFVESPTWLKLATRPTGCVPCPACKQVFVINGTTHCDLCHALLNESCIHNKPATTVEPPQESTQGCQAIQTTSDTMATPVLLPCPFCGGRDLHYESSLDVVICNTQGCKAENDLCSWNQRKDDRADKAGVCLDAINHECIRVFPNSSGKPLTNLVKDMADLVLRPNTAETTLKLVTAAVKGNSVAGATPHSVPLVQDVLNLVSRAQKAEATVVDIAEVMRGAIPPWSLVSVGE